jgi:hypothetical protein
MDKEVQLGSCYSMMTNRSTSTIMVASDSIIPKSVVDAWYRCLYHTVPYITLAKQTRVLPYLQDE